MTQLSNRHARGNEAQSTKQETTMAGATWINRRAKQHRTFGAAVAGAAVGATLMGAAALGLAGSSDGGAAETPINAMTASAEVSRSSGLSEQEVNLEGVFAIVSGAVGDSEAGLDAPRGAIFISTTASDVGITRSSGLTDEEVHLEGVFTAAAAAMGDSEAGLDAPRGAIFISTTASDVGITRSSGLTDEEVHPEGAFAIVDDADRVDHGWDAPRGPRFG